MFQLLGIQIVLTLSLVAFAGNNVEVKAHMVEHDKKYIYMESKTDRYKLSKKELTPEGVEQIIKNKGKELTIFVPEKSIKSKEPVPIEEDPH